MIITYGLYFAINAQHCHIVSVDEPFIIQLEKKLVRLNFSATTKKYTEKIHGILRLKDKGDIKVYKSVYHQTELVNNYIKITSNKQLITSREFPIINKYDQVNTITKKVFTSGRNKIILSNKNGVNIIFFKGDLDYCHNLLK
jgi:hypothetical protein